MQSMASLKKRPTIGLLFRSFWHTNINRWDGALKAAQDLDVNLITYIGGLLNSPEGYESQSNVLYKMVDRDNIDALIIWPLTIGTYITKEEMEAFLRQYREFPLVCVEKSYDGIPSVLQSDYQGIRDLVFHLVKVHQLSRIAFLRGPLNNAAAEERYRSYQTVLEELGLPLDLKLISTPVGWSRGADAIKELLDGYHQKPGIDFEAVIAANSTLMVDAAQVLSERGIKIPDDLAVVGFDNLDQSKAMNPPLTVAFSNFQDLSRKAVEVILDILNGKTVPEKTIIPTRLLIRQSCGCHWKTLDHNLKSSLDGDGVTLSKSTLKERIIAELIQTGVESQKAAEWAEELAKEFALELEKSGGKFIKTLSGLMGQINIISGEEFIHWQNILTEMQCNTTADFSMDNEAIRRVNGVLHQARIIVNEISERKLVEKGIHSKLKSDILQEIGASLITTFNLDEIKNVMFKGLPRLGIPACYLSLYENPEEPSRWSRLIWAFNQKGLLDIPEGGIRFPSSSLLPEGILPEGQRYSFVVEPLYFEKEQIGFVIFECGSDDGVTYTVLRTMLSNAIRGANILQKQKQTEEDLKRKAHELARSNAELEQFAYIVSHDLQEPLRKILAFGDCFKKVCPENLNEQALDYLGRMQSAAGRMQGLINDLLSYSRITTKARTFEKVDLNEVCLEVLSDLETRISQYDAKVIIGNLPVIDADPLQMRQLFQNLLVNALKFHRPAITPLVKVYAFPQGESVEIVFEDNGIGIAEEYQERIFGVFERLHGRNDYEGSGIGLAICKKIVDRHGGKIKIQSEVGKGSKFIVELPIFH
ncbi:MAG: ATP-binding protein [Bacteroidota bacterium]